MDGVTNKNDDRQQMGEKGKEQLTGASNAESMDFQDQRKESENIPTCKNGSTDSKNTLPTLTHKNASYKPQLAFSKKLLLNTEDTTDSAIEMEISIAELASAVARAFNPGLVTFLVKHPKPTR